MAVLFDEKVADGYDERNQRFSAIQANLHFLTGVLLKPLPADARVLCVGAGTGAEILALGQANPGWRFVAVEPSAAMLDICKVKLQKHGLLARCELFHGYLEDYTPSHASFDAVLAILVTQFLTDTQARQGLFDRMASHLVPGGALINAELCGAMDSAEFVAMAQPWAAMHQLGAASPQDAASIVAAWRAHVAVVPPAVIAGMLEKAGLPEPMLFFQSLFIHAWYAQKPKAVR